MKNKIIIVLCIVIILTQIYMIHLLTFRREDVNKDGRVDALDLLIVQRTIISDRERESDK